MFYRYRDKITGEVEVVDHEEIERDQMEEKGYEYLGPDVKDEGDGE